MTLNLDLGKTKDDLYGILKDTDDTATLEWLMASDKNLLKAELYVAERMARIGGKRKTYDTHSIEVYLNENLDRLTEQLYNYEYKPSRGTAHIIHNPVIREIFAAPYIDRIVHHWIVDTIYPWWDTRLWYGSSSCRVGKGTSYAIKLLDRQIRRVSHNYAIPVTVVKLDISGYFMHILREKLLMKVIEGLDKQFKGDYNKRYKIIKNAIEVVIMDDPIDGVKIQGSYEDWRGLPEDKSLFVAAPGSGLVIGNVTSQVFSNIYLDPLDRFVAHELGYKYYGRYVDDFYIVVTDDQLPQVDRGIKAINNFLHTLGLSLNTKKTRKIPAWQGVPFLGMVIKKGFIVPDKRIARNYRKSAYDYIAGMANRASVVSYVGLMKNYDSWKVIEKAFRGNEGLLRDLLNLTGEPAGRVEFFQ